MKKAKEKNVNLHITNYPASSYLFKVKNINIRTMCEYAPKLKMRTPG